MFLSSFQANLKALGVVCPCPRKLPSLIIYCSLAQLCLIVVQRLLWYELQTRIRFICLTMIKCYNLCIIRLFKPLYNAGSLPALYCRRLDVPAVTSGLKFGSVLCCQAYKLHLAINPDYFV
jgi:hypothetical protein